MALGYLYLLGYIFGVGIATFLMRFAMKNLNVWQINLLMAIGMIITTLPGMYLVQKNFKFPSEGLGLGILAAFLMAVGSLSFVFAITKLPVGLASALSTSYVLVVVILSAFFLRESVTPLKIAGIVLTLLGVAILSLT